SSLFPPDRAGGPSGFARRRPPSPHSGLGGLPGWRSGNAVPSGRPRRVPGRGRVGRFFGPAGDLAPPGPTGAARRGTNRLHVRSISLAIAPERATMVSGAPPPGAMEVVPDAVHETVARAGDRDRRLVLRPRLLRPADLPPGAAHPG